MRTLEEIRKKNNRSDLLLSGMENVSVSLPIDVQKNEKEFYKNFVKPQVERMFIKHLSNND